MEISAEQLAALVKGEVEGDPKVIINHYAKIEEARTGSLTFLANPKYSHYIYTTNASAVLVNKTFKSEHSINTTLIRVDDAYATLAELLKMVSASKPKKVGIEAQTQIDDSVIIPANVYVGSFTYVSKGVTIGDYTQIYPQCYIGENVKIGKNVILYAGVKIYADCVIGDNCILHSGVVIGADGFGFAPENGEYEKIAQIGNVVLEDKVEIGANTTIDRATMGSTIIHHGVKLDNLIQVAHNVEIGENTVMAAQVGVAGSTKIGKHNMIGGQVGFAGHIKVGDFNQIGAQSGIPNNVGDSNRLMGYPAVSDRDFARQTVYIKNLGALNREVSLLKKDIKDLKEDESKSK